MSAVSEFILIDAREIADQLDTDVAMLIEMGQLPMSLFGIYGTMVTAAKRLRALHTDRILDRTVPGWSGWTQIAEGWLIKVSAHDDEVWLNMRGPQGAQHNGIVMRKSADSGQGQMLLDLRKTLVELR